MLIDHLHWVILNICLVCYFASKDAVEYFIIVWGQCFHFHTFTLKRKHAVQIPIEMIRTYTRHFFIRISYDGSKYRYCIVTTFHLMFLSFLFIIENEKIHRKGNKHDKRMMKLRND